MSSVRLPGKVMLEVCNKSFLEHMIKRITQSKKLDSVVVATTTNSNDDVIFNLCNSLGINCFRGSENNVLSRFKMVSDKINSDIIVRLNADSPTIDPMILDDTLEIFLENKYDYVATGFPPPRTFPDGFSIEVFSSKILTQLHLEAKQTFEREHVTPYVWLQPKKFSIFRLDYEKDLSKYRLSLDYKEDYIVIKSIFENLYPKNPCFTLEDIISWLEKNPEIQKINSHFRPSEGIFKSFKQDKEAGF